MLTHRRVATSISVLGLAAGLLASPAAGAADTPATAAPATDATPAVPVKKGRARPSDYGLMGGEALNGGTVAIYGNLGAPFVGAGIAVGIARRLNIGLALRSVYTLGNSPELSLKLYLLGNKKCADTALGGTCFVQNALALQFTGGYMLGGTVDREVTLPNGSVSYRLSGLPSYIDDTRHLLITPAIVYSFEGSLFARAQMLIQKFTEDVDPTGAPRDKMSFMPELVGGTELAVGTRIHFYLEIGAGAYIDNNAPVAGNPLETERRITASGHVEAGLALFVY